jgi:hypothetical protein
MRNKIAQILRHRFSDSGSTRSRRQTSRISRLGTTPADGAASRCVSADDWRARCRQSSAAMRYAAALCVHACVTTNTSKQRHLYFDSYESTEQMRVIACVTATHRQQRCISIRMKRNAFTFIDAESVALRRQLRKHFAQFRRAVDGDRRVVRRRWPRH